MILGQLPENVLIEFKPGVWGFGGNVRADLAYVQKDGSPATEKQIANARHVGPRIAGLKTRVFASEAEALAAKAELA